MTGPDISMPGATIIIVTLFTMNRVLAWARRRSPLVKRLLDFPATVLARDGAWIPEALAIEELDDDDLGAALREHGLESISEVKLATLEPDGSVSIVPNDGRMVSQRARRRRYRRRQGA